MNNFIKTISSLLCLKFARTQSLAQKSAMDSTVSPEDEDQDIAVIELEKTGDASAVIEIVGDEDIYGEELIIEPEGSGETKRGSGPRAESAFEDSHPVVVNVWLRVVNADAVYKPFRSSSVTVHRRHSTAVGNYRLTKTWTPVAGPRGNTMTVKKTTVKGTAEKLKAGKLR